MNNLGMFSKKDEYFSESSSDLPETQGSQVLMRHKEEKLKETELKLNDTLKPRTTYRASSGSQSPTEYQQYFQTSDSQKVPKENISALANWWEEQARIQEQVKRVCQKYGASLRREINPEMFSYSQEYNLLYCRNQKVASSTWVQKTYRHLTGLSEEELSQHVRPANGYDNNMYGWTLDRFRVENAEAVRNLENTAVSFSVVRHPFERLVSAYENKILIESPLSRNFEQLFGKPTFSKFVNMIIEDSSNCRLHFCQSLNEHWRPYLSSCSYCDMSFTVITKMENVDRDRKIILDMVGAGVLFKEYARENQSVGDTIKNVTMNYFRQLPRRLAERLRNIYWTDLEMFGYDTNVYLELTLE